MIAAAMVVWSTLLAVARVEELWGAEGETLQRLVEVTRGADQLEALHRLAQWERDSAERASDVDAIVREAHLDAADRAWSAAANTASWGDRPKYWFALGELRRSRQRLNEAETALSAVVEQSPQHPLAVDAAIALGDDAFEAGKLAAAMERYEFARAHAKASDGTRAYAAYKLAWCRLNLEEFEAARALLTTAAEGAERDPRSAGLARQARRDLVVAYARDPAVGIDEARTGLSQRASADDARRAMTEYARRIRSAGREREAARLLRTLERGATIEDLVPILTLEVELAAAARDEADLVHASEALADAMERSGAEASVEAADQALRTATVTLHGEARAADDRDRLELARRLYDAYFRAFPNGAGAYELHHHAGELHLALGRDHEAERHFSLAVAADLALLRSGQGPGRWLESAAEGAVDAAARSVTDLASSTTPPEPSDESVDDPVVPPSPLSADEQLLFEACARYLEALPKGAQHSRVAYRRALLLFQHARWSEAAIEFSRLTGGGDDVAVFASRLALEALRRMHRYEEAAMLARNLRAHAGIEAKVANELAMIEEGAWLAEAALAERRGGLNEALARYLAFVESYPASMRRTTALYNAAAILTRLHRPSEAIAVRDRILSSALSGPLVESSKALQFDALVEVGRFAEAHHLARAAVPTVAKGEALSWRARAIVAAQAAGLEREAAALHRASLDRLPRGVEAFRHARALALSARGCRAETMAWRRAVEVSIDLDKASALAALARREFSCGLGGARLHALQAMELGRASRDPRALDVVADAAFVLSLAAVDRYRTAPVASPYERTLTRKLSLFNQAEAELARVVSLGRAESAVCALVTSGANHALLAKALLEAVPPASFDEDQRALFQDQLEERSRPFSERAQLTLESALERARDSLVRPSCLDEAARQLAHLDPAHHGPRLDTPKALSVPVARDDVDAVAVLSAAPDAPRAWILGAWSELSRGRPWAAMALAARVPTLDPARAEAEEVLATADAMLGQRTSAFARWYRLAQTEPAREAPLRALADAALAIRDDAGALPWLERLASLVPSDGAVAIDLAFVLRSLGRVDEARSRLEALLSSDRAPPEAWLSLGALLCGEGGAPVEGLRALDAFVRSDAVVPDSARFEAAYVACRSLAAESGR